MENKLCSCFCKKHLTLGNLFKIVCSLLTLFLIFQEFYTFVAVKPTSTSKEEKELEPKDLPETVVCLEPGFDSVALEKYGYTINKYYRGSMDGKKFVGWKGNEMGNKSTNAILEEVLKVDTSFRSLFSFLAFSKDHADRFVNGEVMFRTLVYPHGRCLGISPPKLKASNKGINCLSLGIRA